MMNPNDLFTTAVTMSLTTPVAGLTFISQAFLSTWAVSPETIQTNLSFVQRANDCAKGVINKGDAGQEFFDANICLAGFAHSKRHFQKALSYCDAAIDSKYANESTKARALVNQLAGRIYYEMDVKHHDEHGKFMTIAKKNPGIEYFFEANEWDPLLYIARSRRITYMHLYFYNPKRLEEPKEELIWNLVNIWRFMLEDCQILEKQLEAGEIPYCKEVAEAFSQFAYHVKAGECYESDLVPGYTSKYWFEKSMQAFSRISGELHGSEIAKERYEEMNYELIEKFRNQEAKKIALTLKEKLKRCQRCLMVYYCSTDCQKANWQREHKIVCKMMKETMTAGNSKLKAKE
ncbi:hypothetical protein BCR33DRAFT_714792 [Rhizoclosmatium globosum]|uniref:MYND-type domain-containing protein n=1 Tax=Rhizoclosmatium globosum TaxID=329046 RepID=A0A1Y2CL34_9FUNG|nr:hypothetical protein BCR33DRAFT_714792 [Rhizoclosmatium globosum]|eukprot:ORY47710.1 hypothetical protein BCR33DRAFT_714792 [Rhizoclosmatium globosum]